MGGSLDINGIIIRHVLVGIMVYCSKGVVRICIVY